MTPMTLLLFIAGFVLLIGGADLLVRGASRLAVVIGISPLVVGLTVVAYGTSAPELAVTVRAMYAVPARSDLAIGNVVGSNISNILLVLGISATVAPLVVSRQLVRRSVPSMVFVSILVWILGYDGQIGRADGALLFGGAVLYTLVSIRRSRRAVAVRRALEQEADSPTRKPTRSVLPQFAWIVAGLVLLVVGARWLVDGATDVARMLHVSELIIGLTVVAVGTSLPEIATSLIASLRGQREIAVGNVVGSNIFNVLLVLGLCALVAPVPVVVAPAALRFDIPIMIAVAFACWPILYTGWKITRWEGLFFLAYYVAYTVFLFLQATRHGALQEYRTVMLYFVLPLTALVLVLSVIRFRQRDRENERGGALP